MRELPTGWTFLLTIENFDQISTTNKKIKTQDCLESGMYPVIDQGQASISGYINDFDKVIEVSEPLIIFGDHTRTVKWVERDFVPGADGIKVLKPKPYLYSRFSYHQLKSLDIPEKGYSRHFKFLKEILFSIPPLNEQIRIANKLDSVLAKVDAAQARLEKIPTLLKRFRQSVLAAASSGELTKEWRDENGVSFENWTSKTISEITIKCFDGPFGSKLKTADYTTEGVRVARLENIGHLKFLHEKETFISEEKFESLIGNKLADMDILFSSFVDEEVRTCIFRGELGTYINKADCFCLRTDSSQCLPEFLVLRLACKSTFEKVKGQVHGATRPRINLKFLKSLKLKIPSVQEQIEIVRRVESLFTLADTVEKQYLAAKQRLDRFSQSLLAKAFRGELVPQDPNDEPAAELLKRIQAERNAQPPVKNKRAKSA